MEDPLNIHKTEPNETTLVSNILNIISKENVIIAIRQGNKPVLILSDKFCEEQAFLYLIRKGKFDYNAPGGIPISTVWYFNHRLFNVNLYSASNAVYRFFAR